MHNISMEYVCKEIDEIESKIESSKDIPKTDVQYLDTLYHLKKDILASEQMEDSYSERDDASYRGTSRRGGYAEGYDGDSSRDDRSMARGRMRAPRDSMGRYSGNYSRKGEIDELMDELRDVTRELSSDARMKVERVIRKHENA